MKTLRKVDGDMTFFIITDLTNPLYIQAAKDFGYNPIAEGLARPYPTISPHLDMAFDHFSRNIETMLLQKAGELPTPWEDALLRYIETVGGHAVDWWLIGSAAVAVRGIDVQPGDIDLGVAESDGQRLGDILVNYLMEPVQDSSGWVGKWFGRTFMGVCLEWLGGVTQAADAYGISDFGPVAVSRLETVIWRDHLVRVPPLQLSYDINIRRGRIERAEMIGKAMRSG